MPAAELKVYQPVWRCIYCGAAPTRKGALGKEHIIPQGLGGTLILPRASCRSCEDITKRIEKVHTYLGPSFHQKMRHIGANTAFTLFPIGEFFQMLAKIGHAYAVAEIGFSHFSPLLVDLILGRDDHLGHHIGTETENPGSKTTKLHTLALMSARDANGDELIVVNVGLFARLSAPPYHVVVGRPLL